MQHNSNPQWAKTEPEKVEFDRRALDTRSVAAKSAAGDCVEISSLTGAVRPIMEDHSGG